MEQWISHGKRVLPFLALLDDIDFSKGGVLTALGLPFTLMCAFVHLFYYYLQGITTRP